MGHERSADHVTFKYLVEHSPFGVCVVDADFRLIHASAAAQKAFSSEAPMVGRDLAETLRTVWTEPFASEAIAKFRHTLETGEPYQTSRTVERRHDLDELESYDWKIERVTLPDGSFGVVCHFYDLSERQRYEQALRDSEGRFRQLADAMPQLVWMANNDGTVTYYNSQVSRYAGIQRSSDDVWHWRPVVHPDDLPRTMATWQRAVARGHDYECEHRVRMTDGSYRWHLSRARCIDGAQWFGTATDVHELKEAQERLRESQQELHRLNAELSEASRRKDEFLAMLGHELRNPLAAIHAATQLMKLVAPEDGRLQRTQGVLERQSVHMTRLIDGLLEVSRIARGKIRLDCETLDLRHVIDMLMHDRVAQIEARGLSLHREVPSEPVWVLADPIRLAQILDNLLGNAIKFTAAPGRIDVSLHAQGHEALICVRDTGVGMRPEMLERVFEPFQQESQDIHRGAGGLGLGLALAKGLVDLHGGSIRAHSQGRGTGATFEVRLPLTSAPTVERRVEQPAKLEARRILIVEDNVDAGQTLHALLEMLGHQVSVAETGGDALARLRTRGADVVLCDLGLPGMSGHEVAQAIRRDDSLRNTYLVALTGYGQPEDRKRSAAAGFDDHLTKPVDLGELNAVLRRLG